MRALVSGDWQLSPSNLTRFAEFSKWLLAKAERLKCTHIVHLGDVKHAFNPVDLRVMKAFCTFVRRARKQGLTVVVQEGNHDLLAVRGTESWLSLLSLAGCTVVTKPTMLKLGDCRAFFLPFSEDKEGERASLKRFAAQANSSDSVLFFHDEVAGCRYNVITRYDGKGLRVKDFCVRKYKCALGGHIHLPQTVSEGLYFVGSPWSHDWGEVNQRKMVVLLDTNASEPIKWIATELPGLYDPLLPKFNESRPVSRDGTCSWAGHTVRVRVSVPANRNLQEALDEAKLAAQTKYKGAIVTAVPSRISETTQIGQTETLDLVARWVKANCPDNLKEREAQIVAFLNHYLGRLSFAQRGRIRVRKLLGHNVLGFKDFQFRFSRPGMTLVQGKNLQWQGRSNGSGKSSALQTIAVAGYGKTLKGQKNDSWLKRGSKGKGFVTLTLSIGEQQVQIHRARRPIALTVHVDGKNRSIGTAVDTQREIERIIGLDWGTFVSALYIDSQTVSTFVDGTEAERKAILGKFLGLEQFEIAQLKFKAQLRKFQEELSICRAETPALEAQIQSNRKALGSLPKAKVSEIEQSISAQVKVLGTCTERAASLAAQDLQLSEESEEIRGKIAKLGRVEMDASLTHRAATKRIQSLRGMEGLCTACQQPVGEQHKSKCEETALLEIKTGKQTEREATAKLDVLRESLEETLTKLRKVKAFSNDCRDTTFHVRSEIKSLKTALEFAKRDQEVRAELQRATAHAKARLRLVNDAAALYQGELAFLTFAIKAVGRDGLRTHLVHQICPALDAAVQLYADSFAENALRPRFSVKDGELDFSIDNPNGGSNLDDQSRGERCLLSLITSLALRDVFSPFDLVIFDEPGEGLDEKNARQFAVGLSQIATRFRSILITSHNSHLLEELTPDRKVTIVKENGNARIEN